MAAAASVPTIARAGSSKDVKMAVASMPTDDVVKRGWLEKRVVSRESSVELWRAMDCRLTSDTLFLGKPTSSYLLDRIELVEITDIIIIVDNKSMPTALDNNASAKRKFQRQAFTQDETKLDEKVRKQRKQRLSIALSPEAANELRDIEGAVRSGTPMSSPETVNQGLSTGDLYHSQSPRAGREAGDGEIPDCHLEIRTNPYGDNQGRKYMLRAVSPDETTLWTQAIREQMKHAHKAKFKAFNYTLVEKVRFRARKVRKSTAFAIFANSALMAAFVLSIIMAEVGFDSLEAYNNSDLGSPIRSRVSVEAAQAMDVLDKILTACFTCELAVIWGSEWCRSFFFSWRTGIKGWNCFDFVVVIGCLIRIALPGMAPLYPLRIMRVLRAVRLLQRGSLKVLMDALAGALEPVVQSFLLLGLVSSIYAIMGVALFSQQAPHIFGSFFKALFTIFECTTGEGWSQHVRDISLVDRNGRPIDVDQGFLDPSAVVFFVSFMLIGAMVLVNIVVAVLLDEFLNAMAQNRNQAVEQADVDGKWSGYFDMHSLDPLMEQLTHFKSAKDLDESISSIFSKCDVNKNGELSFLELHEGLKALCEIYVSQHDWQEMKVKFLGHAERGIRTTAFGHSTSSMADDDVEDSVSLPEFRALMIEQLKLYLIKNVNKTLLMPNPDTVVLLPMVKWMMICMQEGQLGTSSPGPGQPRAAAANPTCTLLTRRSNHARKRREQPERDSSAILMSDSVLVSESASRDPARRPLGESMDCDSCGRVLEEVRALRQDLAHLLAGQAGRDLSDKLSTGY